MKLSDPYLLFLLWGLIPLAGLLVYGIRRHKRILSGFADAGMHSHILPGLSYTRRWVKLTLVLAGFALAVIALAGPRYGFRWEKTTQKGVDIMIALDCSRSMLAADVSPTRLERAKREIIDLTRLLRSDRAGLAAFAGRAVLQCPLTLDYNAFAVFLDALNPDYLPVGGTNLHEAIRICVDGFDPEADTEKAIIVITDGEDTSGLGAEALMDMAKELAEQRIRLFAIGVGDPSGAPIPDPSGGFKKDAGGNIILSRVDETTLQNLTAVTNGRYVRSVAGDMDLEQIYTRDILGTMERSTLTQGRKKVWEHRFQWVLLPALILLLLDFIIPDHKPARPGRWTNTRSLLSVLLLCMVCTAFLPENALAGIFSSHVKEGIKAYDNNEFQKAKKHFIDAQLDSPEELKHYYNIGTAAYAAGEYDLAAGNFVQAAGAEDKELRRNAKFNLANTRYRQGRLDEAEKEYEALLKEFPEDEQAKANLAFVRQKKKEKEAQQNQPGNGENPPEGEQKDQASGDENGEQNQDKQNSQNQNDNDPDSNNQDGNNQDKDQGDQDSQPSHQGKSKPSEGAGNQNKDDRNKADQAKGTEEQPPMPVPEPGEDNQESGGKTGEAEDEGQNTGMGKVGGATSDPQADAEGRMLENRLNRLSDKPGMALMPGGNVNVERDW
ncbi:MAG: VWA domain-containing protein [Desulfobacterales bacterium]|nr:VWA domain-containing protein [Desulfobacterales bacterium]